MNCPDMSESIAFANHKGGTGKTTSCINIAGYLAKSGHKVLVVDFDPQANATSGLGIDSHSLKYSIYDAVLNYCNGHEGVPINRVILATDIENLHIAPSEIDLSVVEVFMQNSVNRDNILSRILKGVKSVYDYILIDLPTSSGLLTINGLCALDHLIVPVDPSIFSIEALDNLKLSINDVKRLSGHSINKITAVLIRYIKPALLSRISGRLNPSQEVERRLKEMFHSVYVVPDSAEIYRSQKEGVPLSHFAPNSDAGKAYEKITNEIIKEGGGSRNLADVKR